MKLHDLRPPAGDALDDGVGEGEIFRRSERRRGMERPAGRHDDLLDRSLGCGRQPGLGHVFPPRLSGSYPPPVSISLCYQFNLTDLILTS